MQSWNFLVPYNYICRQCMVASVVGQGYILDVESRVA